MGFGLKPLFAVLLFGVGLGLNLNPVNGLGIMTQLLAKTRGLATGEFGQPLRIKQGETISLNSGQLGITFVAVVQDSRCPRGAQCVWAGQAVINLALQNPTQPLTPITLTLNNEPQAVPELPGYKIKFSALTPYPSHPPSSEPRIPEITLSLFPN
ncbi:hypothetical protein RIF25_04805 [Thermosynechococcaceae cyanobacterium BACA0444]|uniref:Uncharacterized protein n=1 Tax=Pseudocalidococcus azoricus BACA0444 TaxID=2918990 RepID=A0AAE4FQ59_9CYAN|nr:hypothetical protein [Pseudocalidococcus azoricus]MDS3860120.1 hypothetical protein [Pseudocalidococcus azoricus BACA0444]